MAGGTAGKADTRAVADRAKDDGADRDDPTRGTNSGETNLSVGIKRAAEMAAVFMIGDGTLGLLQPSRHVDLWRSRVGPVDALIRPFGGRPGRRRAYGVLQVAAGIALAAALRPKR